MISVLIISAAVVALLIIALVWYLTYRRRKYNQLPGTRNPAAGFDNINYGEVDCSNYPPTSKPRVPSDYEVPHPSRHYTNIPPHSANRFTDSNRSRGTSGIYSYVFVQRPRSYDSHFLQSSDGSVDLPTVVAAESGEPVNGRPTANYVLLQQNFH